MSPGSHLSAVAVAQKDSGTIRIYDGSGSNEPIHVLDKLHGQTVTGIRYDPIHKVAISTDSQGMIEYWSGQEGDFKFPDNVKFKFKTDTDLYELMKKKTHAKCVAISPNGKLFACLTANRKAYVFHLLTGKLSRVFDESLNFSRRSPDDANSKEADRDIFNEKPSKDEVLAAMQVAEKRVSDKAIIHTTIGDIHVKLYQNECPKTAENFCVHSRDGYYNGHIFHRVIKGFMVQTGDPLGSGTGGESIWGGEFEDEFHPTLSHDRAYTVSMANAGPDTNGSQFFITVVPTPWLDNKHTVFGRVTKGMEVVHNISLVKTHPKTDKPYDDISIVNITVK